jgi:hypothetical protein
MRTRTLPLVVVLLAVSAAVPASAKDWYKHYKDAETAIREDRCDDAMKDLQATIALKPESHRRVPSYGLEYLDYFPYYLQGICYLKKGDYRNALTRFNTDAHNGEILRSAYSKDFVRYKTDAEAMEKQDQLALVARKAHERVAQLVKEATDAENAGRLEEALPKLAEAKSSASSDTDQQQRIEAQIARIRERLNAIETAAADTRRLDQALADGRQLLEAGNFTGAVIKFDEVLTLHPGHTAALEGKRRAAEGILASNSRESLRVKFEEGKALYDAAKYDAALPLLTDAATDPRNTLAVELLDRTKRILEATRRQKDQSQRITSLFAEAERLFAARRYPEAQVRFESILAVDPENLRAQERRTTVERLIGEALIDRWLPPRAPQLLVYEPSQLDISQPSALFDGVATDDRGIARVEFLLGGKLIHEIPVAEAHPGDTDRHTTVRLHDSLDLAMGPNDIVVRATDTQGQKVEIPFRITRHPRFYERRWFLPAALATSLSFIGLGFGAQHLRQRQAVRRRFNPYIAGAPILNDAMFFGRQKLLARILNVLHHNSLMITGERRIGKTTLLYQLKKALEADDTTEYRFFPAFIDLQGVAEESFFHSVIADVLEDLHPSAETMATLRYRETEPHYDGRDFSHDLQRVIEDLKRRTSKKVKLALLIDEVDVLNSFSERINQRLRSIFMKTFSEHLVAIMSGVGIKRIWTSEGSPWYNFFDEIELVPFSREEAELLIRQPVEGYFRFEPEAVEAILRWSGGKPYLVQKICIHSVNRMLEEGRTRVTAKDVEAVRHMPRTFAEDEALTEREAASV